MNLLSLPCFSIHLMIACLWDVLKWSFSLTSNRESTKIPSVHSKMFHKILLLIHRWLEICHFASFSENCINLFWLIFLTKFHLIFRVLEYQHHQNISPFLLQFFISMFWKEFAKILLCVLKMYVYICMYMACNFFITNKFFYCILGSSLFF